MVISYRPQDYDVLIGIDVDQYSFSFTAKNMNYYNMQRTKKIPASAEDLENYINKNFAKRKVLCAYEAGPTGYHLYDYLNQHCIDCVVVSPTSIPHSPNERVKTNRIDSRKLTQHLSNCDLKAVRVPEGAYRQLRHLVAIRELYSYKRKATKQRIKALLLLEHFIPILERIDKNYSANQIRLLRDFPCNQAVRCRLDLLLDDLAYARAKILSIHRAMREFIKQHPEIKDNIQYLRSLPGVGFVYAVGVLGKIGDPQYLRSPREIAAFVGLVPKEKSTGDKIKRSSITHIGSQSLRFLLIEAAWVAIRHDTHLGQCYHRIRKRHHPGIGAQKAITAIARKLTERMYRVLKEQRLYRK
ncbi:MAG: IS110 family transposase [Candidatus Omnitrophota bacterium]